MVLLSVEAVGRKHNHADRLGRKQFITVTVVSAGIKRSHPVLAEAKYDGQCRQESKIAGLVYTLFYCTFVLSHDMSL